MDLEIIFHATDDYLIARVEGDWTVDAAEQGIAQVAKAAKEKGFSRILIDICGLSPPPSELTRFLTGEEVAKVWGYPARFKVAAVYRKDLINKLVENVAVNRGANFIVLSDMDEAIEWLKESPISESS